MASVRAKIFPERAGEAAGEAVGLLRVRGGRGEERDPRLFDGATQPALEVLQKGNYCGDGNTDRLWAFPTLETLAIGIHSYDAYAYRMWIDDVAYGTARLGCED